MTRRGICIGKASTSLFGDDIDKGIVCAARDTDTDTVRERARLGREGDYMWCDA
jgi:hypothetical protein